MPERVTRILRVPRLDYGPCGSDYRNVENIVLVTKSNFPIGNRFVALLVNNWEFAPLFHIVSGAPFTVTSGQDNSFTDVGNDRPEPGFWGAALSEPTVTQGSRPGEPWIPESCSVCSGHSGVSDDPA